MTEEPTDPQPEYAPEYTFRERLRIAGYLTLAAVGFGILLWGAEQWLVSDEILDVAFCSSFLGIDGLTWLLYGVMVLIPASFLLVITFILCRRGQKILRDGQSPPIGEKVLRPTRIRRGSQAQSIGYAHFISIGVSGLVTLLLSVMTVGRLEMIARPAPEQLVQICP